MNTLLRNAANARVGGSIARRFIDQIVEQRPIMDHCLTQVFGARLTARMTYRNGMSGAIIGDDFAVINRQVGCTLFEIADRIAACFHHIAQQHIGMADGTVGIIDDLALNTLSVTHEIVALRCR